MRGAARRIFAALAEALDYDGHGFPSLLDGLISEAITDAGVRSLRENRPIPITYEFDD